MAQWLKLLTTFSPGQRLALVLVALAVVGGLFAFTRWRREADLRPLYSEMSSEDAGAVVARLREGGVDYRLSEDGRTIRVPSASVAELRLNMASAGLPRNGRLGFELFDRTNFGATEFTEHVNYARALEGELERSIMHLTEVEQARVHVTFSKDSAFVESRQPAKGSVLLKLRAGSHLYPQNVAAVCHLVASAVEGLNPESVSVLDMNGNLLNRPRKPGAGGAEAPDAMVEHRQSLERDLVAKIQSTLEPLLGPDRFRATAAVECDFTSGEQSEETFDPSRSVMVTSQKTEDLSGAVSAAGVPGTASNLPRPTSRPGTTPSGLSRRTENIAYQSSRVVRRVKLPQGSIKRLSVSVVVDHTLRWEGAGPKARRVLEAPAPERIKAIQDLVAAAIGFQPLRGDQLVVESLPFETTLNVPPPDVSPAPAPPAPGGVPRWLQQLLAGRRMEVIAAGGGALLLLLAAVFLLARKKRRHSVDLSAPRELPSAEPSGAAASVERLAAQTASEPLPELPPMKPKRADAVTERLRELVATDAAGSAQVLRSWLSDEER